MIHRQRIRSRLGASLLAMTIGLAACSGNLFGEFADTSTDEALIFEVNQALDRGNYSEAITLIESMTAAAQADRANILLKASAHAGLCGFEFLTFVEDIADSGGGRFFEILMTSMPNSTASSQAECVTSMNLIQSINVAASSRDEDENLLMSLVSLATIGAILNVSADSDNDDVVDAAFDHCTLPSSVDTRQTVAALANSLESLTAIGSSTVAEDEMESLTTICTDLEASLGAGFNFCSATQVSDVTSDFEEAMRGLIGSDNSIGLGNSVSCNPGDSEVVCALACP